MFTCATCRKPSKPREKMHKMVILQREKHYPEGGHGLETVIEIGICGRCAKLLEEEKTDA